MASSIDSLAALLDAGDDSLKDRLAVFGGKSGLSCAHFAGLHISCAVQRAGSTTDLGQQGHSGLLERFADIIVILGKN